MKILVTGSNGFLGAAVVERLILEGYSDIRCFTREGSNLERLNTLQSQYENVHLEIFTGTLATVQGAIKALSGVDVVFHVAAGLSGSAADLFLSSVVASKNLLEAMAQTQFVKIILVSSFGVYGTANLKPNTILNEQSPIETYPEKRDLYSFAKWRQEKLFRDFESTYNFPLIIARPGVIYGPGNTGISARVGLKMFGVFFYLGGRNLIPLSYIENCAEAIVFLGSEPSAVGKIVNIHDNDLPTCLQYINHYICNVEKLRVIPIHYKVLFLISRLVETYHFRSNGQLPAVFTPYKTESIWKGLRYDNSQLKALGWRQTIPTKEGMLRSFVSHKQGNDKN